MEGVLLVDKPAGWTSHDVVAKVRSLLRQSISQQSSVNSQKKLTTGDLRLTASGSKIRVGHTGTLDPAATGLLILVIGSYTKRAAEFSKLDKTYEAEITLGKTSTTGDSEGEITNVSDKKPALGEIEQTLKQFTGKIRQTPHAYSAIKVGGRRAYDLARQGKEVALEPREVTIYRIDILGYEYPKLRITTHVSSGTYIRSLAEDIGQNLGTDAYLSALRRTSVGEFDIGDTIKIDSPDVDLGNHLQK